MRKEKIGVDSMQVVKQEQMKEEKGWNREECRRGQSTREQSEGEQRRKNKQIHLGKELAAQPRNGLTMCLCAGNKEN